LIIIGCLFLLGYLVCREIEWLYGTKTGREELASQAKYKRLAIAHLNRGHSYESLDAIMSELSPKVSELAPKGMPVNYKVMLLVVKIRFLIFAKW
jgi:hypothetical protein